MKGISTSSRSRICGFRMSARAIATRSNQRMSYAFYGKRENIRFWPPDNWEPLLPTAVSKPLHELSASDILDMVQTGRTPEDPWWNLIYWLSYMLLPVLLGLSRNVVSLLREGCWIEECPNIKWALGKRARRSFDIQRGSDLSGCRHQSGYIEVETTNVTVL